MKRGPELRKIGKIEALETKGAPDGLCVVLFHGYGADAYDLASLSEAVSGVSGLNWIFPQGPLQVPIGPNWSGRAWFPIDIAALENAIQSGTTRALAQRRPQGLDRARALAFDMIDQLPFAKSKIIVGGFSQGAMLATELALHAADRFAGLILLSGSMLDEPNWKKAAHNHPPLPFFQSHGIRDQVLPLELAQPVSEMLQEAGWQGSLYEFSGGHEIPNNVLQQMGSFIRDRAKSSK
jgi:phospholipase/carboxylesterase